MKTFTLKYSDQEIILTRDLIVNIVIPIEEFAKEEARAAVKLKYKVVYFKRSLVWNEKLKGHEAIGSPVEAEADSLIIPVNQVEALLKFWRDEPPENGPYR
jgi:hypothetical protein